VATEHSKELLGLAELLLEGAADTISTPAAALALAELRAEQGRYIEAVRIAEDQARKHPGDAAAPLFLARVYLTLGETEEGLRQVALARGLEPDDPAARFLEGRLLATQPATAERGIEQMLRAYEDEVRVRQVNELVDGVQIALQSLRSQGNHQQARRLLDRALAKLPLQPLLILERAVLDKLEGKIESALEGMRQAHERDRKSAEIRNEFALLLRDVGYGSLLQGDRERAVQCFNEALELRPPDVPLDGMQAVVSGSRGGSSVSSEERTRRAREAFDSAVQLYEEGALKDAAATLQESLRWLPDNPLAWLHRGRICLELGQLEEAAPALQNALHLGAEMEIDVEHGYLLLVRAQVGLARFQDARQSADQYATSYPEGAYQELIEALLDVDEEKQESGGE
jgi:tetratricopeptide (TPR) repeat protein